MNPTKVFLQSLIEQNVGASIRPVSDGRRAKSGEEASDFASLIDVARRRPDGPVRVLAGLESHFDDG